MGTSLFEQYQRETKPKPGSLYEQFLAQQDRGPQDITADIQRQVDARQAQINAQGMPIGERLARNAVSLGQGLPGGKMLEAYAASKFAGVPYAEGYKRVDAMTAPLSGAERFGTQLLGSLPLAAIKGSAALVGAGTGAVSGFLDTDPAEGWGGRGWNALKGAAIGGTLGTVGEYAGTRIRGMNAASRDANLNAREVAQSAAASPLYEKALQEGQGLTETDPFIKALNRFRTIRNTAKGIRLADEGQTIPAGRSPELLDKVFKGLTDKETSLEGRLQNLAKGDKSANTIRQQLETVQGLKGQMLDAMGGPGGPMPTYPQAVQTFAEHEAEMAGVKRGYSTATNASSPAGGGVNEIQNTRAGLKRFIAEEQPSPGVRAAVAEGILAKTKERPMVAHAWSTPLPIPNVPAIAATLNDASLLRTVGAPGQSYVDLLTKLGVLAGANLFRP